MTYEMIPSDRLDARAVKVLVAASLLKTPTQRAIAEHSHTSLGMVNLVIKRLVQTGYLKVKSLKGKRLAYILTPKGLSAKFSQSYDYVKRTLKIFTAWKKHLTVMIEELIDKGHRSFVIVGEGEISEMVFLILESYQSAAVQCFRCADETCLPISLNKSIVLDCRLSNQSGNIGVSILEALLHASPHDIDSSVELHSAVK